MEIDISENKYNASQKAAKKGAEIINKSIQSKGQAHILLSTGASQLELMECFVKEPVDWSKVTAFHLDEYVGFPITHPASFRKYLKDRFVDIVKPKELIYIDGQHDIKEECRRLSVLISEVEIDLAFVGIGENAHLAFNDPPAD